MCALVEMRRSLIEEILVRIFDIAVQKANETGRLQMRILLRPILREVTGLDFRRLAPRAKRRLLGIIDSIDCFRVRKTDRTWYVYVDFLNTIYRGQPPTNGKAKYITVGSNDVDEIVVVAMDKIIEAVNTSIGNIVRIKLKHMLPQKYCFINKVGVVQPVAVAIVLLKDVLEEMGFRVVKSTHNYAVEIDKARLYEEILKDIQSVG